MDGIIGTLVVNLQPDLFLHRCIAPERLCLETINFRYFSTVFQPYSFSIKGAVIILLGSILVRYYRHLSGIFVTPLINDFNWALNNLKVCNNAQITLGICFTII